MAMTAIVFGNSAKMRKWPVKYLNTKATYSHGLTSFIGCMMQPSHATKLKSSSQLCTLVWPRTETNHELAFYLYRESVNIILNGIILLIPDTAPMDLVSMSFWFCTNATLSPECRQKAFLTNNVLERILLVCQTLEVNTYNSFHEV